MDRAMKSSCFYHFLSMCQPLKQPLKQLQLASHVTRKITQLKGHPSNVHETFQWGFKTKKQHDFHICSHWFSMICATATSIHLESTLIFSQKKPSHFVLWGSCVEAERKVSTTLGSGLKTGVTNGPARICSVCFEREMCRKEPYSLVKYPILR